MVITHTYLRVLKQSGILLSVAVLLGLGEWLGGLSLLKRSIQLVSQPITVGTASGLYKLQLPIRYVFDKQATAARTEQLEKELNAALATVSTLEQIEQENQQLRQNLGAQARPQKTVIGSPIVSYGIPTISVGTQQGINPGVPVLAASGLVGVVDTVSEQQSTVSLLTHQQSTAILARSQRGTSGLVTGDGRRILFTEVAHDQPLEVGDQVVTSGQSHVPADLFIGTVQEISSDQSAPVKTAVIQQLINFYEVSIVEVLP